MYAIIYIYIFAYIDPDFNHVCKHGISMHFPFVVSGVEPPMAGGHTRSRIC